MFSRYQLKNYCQQNKIIDETKIANKFNFSSANIEGNFESKFQMLLPYPITF